VDGAHWAAAGTLLLTGRARVRLAYTGPETLYGEIVRLALLGTHARTPLQVAIGRLVAMLLTAALLMCVILAVIRLHQGYGIVDALLSAVTLAVAALPEEFPVVFTFFLGAGVYRLAKRQALVRRAVAVENIGRVTCVCSDKTGTMTEGRLVLAHRNPARGVDAGQLAALAALASRPDSGDPLDAAILGLVPVSSRAGYESVRTFPFTEARRCETAIWRLASGECLAVVKGAPETVLARSAIADDERAAWLAKVTEYATAGNKVIGCATRKLDEAAVLGDEPDSGFQFSGLLSRSETRFARCARSRTHPHGCGASAIIDHQGITLGQRSIAAQVGWAEGTDVVVMDELEGALQEGHSVACKVCTRSRESARPEAAPGEDAPATGRSWR
jgi:Ca2+-transporting ATPase